MTEISIKRLKYGESSIIKRRNSQLIVDCGSDNRGNGKNSDLFAYNAIREDVDHHWDTSLLITHFHKDHFNGVFGIPNNVHPFERLYLPYSIVREKNVFSGAISKLLTVASSRSWGFVLSKKIVELLLRLEDLVDDINDICFVKKGDTICLSDIEIQVLWPEIEFDIEGIRIPDKRGKGPIEFPKYIISEEAIDNYIQLGEYNKDLEEEFFELLQTVTNDGIQGQEMMGLEYQFREALNRYLEALHSNENLDKNSDRRNVLQERYNELLIMNASFRKQIRNNEMITNDINRYARAQYHSLIHTMNAISIVFSHTNQFIFLGDIPRSVVEHLKYEYREQYELVKVQHHGTEDHYSDAMPAGNQYVISNGGYLRRKVGNRIIRNFDGERILCTNAHENPSQFCSYYLENGECSKACFQMNHEEIISF